MFEPMVLPAWLLVLILLFATVAALDHVLVPSVRWFLRRRMQRAVDRLNRRLKRPINPFKLARRHDTIQRLLYDAEVMEAVAARARERGEPREVAFEAAAGFAREIVPSFSASAYFGIATRAARWLSRYLYDVRLVVHHEADPAKIDPEAAVVYVMNHRSNMDYVLVTWLVAQHSALSYAVGEWARVWPLAGLIRSMGAYFIRRGERDTLYRRVLRRYVEMSTGEGVMQAVFPEGGLSLDGRLGSPKLGILAAMLDGAAAAKRPLVLVPVAVSYDRVIEDRILTEAARKGARRFRGNPAEVAGFVLRYVWRRLRGRARRFGIAAVSFGAPVTVPPAGAGRPSARELGEEMMRRIGTAMPTLPVPLAAAALLEGPADTAELAVRARRLHGGATLAGGAEAALAVGVAHLRARGLVAEAAGKLEPSGDAAQLLPFYAAMAGQQ